MEEKQIGFTLPKERVFQYVKDGKADLIIANKDFTNFRTLDQLINMKGNIDVKVINIDAMREDLQNLDKDFRRSLYRKRITKYVNEYLFEDHIPSEKYEEYIKIKFERQKSYETIVGNANKYLNALNLEINIDGSVSSLDEDCTAYTLLNSNPTLYFLGSGELLKMSQGPRVSYVIPATNRSPYFLSLNDLIEYKKEVQEDYYKSIKEEQLKNKTKENSEKYLEF